MEELSACIGNAANIDADDDLLEIIEEEDDAEKDEEERRGCPAAVDSRICNFRRFAFKLSTCFRN